MKKVLRIVMCLAMLFAVGIGFAGCENNAIVSIEVKEGTLPKRVIKGSQVNFDDASIVVNILNNKKIEVKKSDINNITYSAVDTSTTGDKTVNISYMGFNTSYDFKVVGITESFILKTGTLKPSYNITLGEEFSFEDFVFTVTYDDDTTEDLGAEYFTFSEVDTTIEGSQEVIVTSKENTDVTYSFEIVLQTTYDVAGYSQPDFIRTYQQHISVQANKENEFTVRDDGYYVGDDNAFIYKPVLTVVYNNEDFELDNYYIDVKVEKLVENNNYVELTGNDLNTNVSIDKFSGAFDFTETAIGNTFKLTVWPAGGGEEDALSLEVKVVDGWNAYDAKDFSRLENNPASATFWQEYKTANNIGNEVINGLILHGNIVLTPDDIPGAYLYKEGDSDVVSTDKDYSVVVGTLRDWRGIYTRQIDADKTFTFIGNYFNVDASKLPLVERDNEDASDTSFSGIVDGKPVFENAITSNARLINFGGDCHYHPAGTQGKVTMKNISFLGNAPKENDLKYTGGMAFVGSSSSELTVDNVISRSFVNHYVTLNVDQKITLVDSKGYDAFSTMFFVWSSQGNSMTNCEFKGSGGPLISLTHVSPEQESGNNRFSTFEIIDCELEALVSANDPWFKIYNADSIATNLIAMNQLFLGTSTALNAQNPMVEKRSFVKQDASGNQQVNFIICLQRGEDPLTCPVMIGGEATFKENDNVVNHVDMRDAAFLASAEASGKALPFFRSSASTELFTVTVGGDGKPSGLGKLTSSGIDGNIDASYIPLFQGDYMNIFAPNGAGSYFGAVVSYYTVA